MALFVEPLPDCESRLQVGAWSHAGDHERSSSSSISKPPNSSPDSIQGANNTRTVNARLRTERAQSTFAMQQYHSQQLQIPMTYDESPRYSFHGSTPEAAFSRSGSDVTPNMILNFGGVTDRLDASARFPGLGELPSNGLMDAGVEHNLSGTFTGDLNSSAYEVGDPDHGCLLQEMLQPTPPPPQPNARFPDAHSQVPASSSSHADWEDSLHALQEMGHLQHHLYTPHAHTDNHQFPTPESDLLNLLHFPRLNPPTFNYPNARPKTPLFSTSTTGSGPVTTEYGSRSMFGYDPAPFHSASQRYFHKASEGGRMPGAPVQLVDLEQERDEASGRGKREQGAGAAAASAKGESRESRGVNHFATERQRREFLNEKYHTLRSLVPNPTKADRASIVADAIEYVKELKQMVQELQQLLQEKRRAVGEANNVKRRRASVDEDPYNKAIGSSLGVEINADLTTVTGPDGLSLDGSPLRCSWLQRTSPTGAHVDVRVVHDEVTIKVNHRRSQSSLLFGFLALLPDLRLDLVHASGATVGEHEVFLFNTKILEGSSIFASYIVVKLLDILDRHLVI